MSQVSEAQDSQSDGTATLGVVLLTAGLAVFTFQDVIVRILSGDYPVHELIFVRGLFAIGLMAGYVYWRYGRAGFRIRKPVFLILRGVMGVSCFTCYYLALATLSMADTVTIAFSSPILFTLFSVILFKEFIGWRRWLAILVGFGGVVVVVGPSGQIADPAVIFAVLGALTYALMNILTRLLKDDMTGPGIAFYQMLAFLSLSAASGLLLGHGGFLDPTGHSSLQFLLRPWVMPELSDLGLIAVTSVIAASGFILLTNAYTVSSNPTVVAPFEYTGVVMGVLAGWAFFAEAPSGWTLLGAMLIVGSGLYILYRENHRGRPVRSVRNPTAILPDPPDVEGREPSDAEILIETLTPDPAAPVENSYHRWGK